MYGLAVATAVFLILSLFALKTLHIPFAMPGRISMLTNFSTNFPTVWNIVRPGPKVGWWLSVIVFLVQIALTGGMFGTLVRINTGDDAAPGSFISDSIRPFGRLLLWNIFWSAVYLFVIWVGGYSIGLSLFVAVIVLLMRYLFIFVEIAFVCEGQDRLKDALTTAVNALFRGIVPMLPYGVAVLLFTGIATKVVYLSPFWLGALVSLAYCLVMLWLYHMIVARYLYYSNWRERWGLTV